MGSSSHSPASRLSESLSSSSLTLILCLSTHCCHTSSLGSYSSLSVTISPLCRNPLPLGNFETPLPLHRASPLSYRVSSRPTVRHQPPPPRVSKLKQLPIVACMQVSSRREEDQGKQKVEMSSKCLHRISKVLVCKLYCVFVIVAEADAMYFIMCGIV
ncbi:hypothetical protein RJT34_12571 [Clitoria ternatea]|uniref:Uncharacterized protein n=1 Tax=Clitoria ternatea TaxID=43366 RepID=A0AAN9PL15_CLITE